MDTKLDRRDKNARWYLRVSELEPYSVYRAFVKNQVANGLLRLLTTGMDESLLENYESLLHRVQRHLEKEKTENEAKI